MTRTIGYFPRRLVLVAFCLLPTVLGLLVSSNDFAAEIENESVKARYQLRGETNPPTNVAFVAVDRRTSNSLFPGWAKENPTYAPIPDRSLWARTIKKLERAGARAVVLAFSFGLLQPGQIPGDQRLVSAIRRSSIPVVVGGLCDTDYPSKATAPALLSKRILRSAGARVGSLCIYSEGAFAQVPLKVAGPGENLATGDEGLAVVLARKLARPVPPSAFRVPEGAADADVERFSWIDFSRSPKALPAISLSDLLRQSRRTQRVDRFGLKGKVVVVGDTDYDFSFRPLRTFSAGDGRLYDGEIYALSISTMLDGYPIRELPQWLEVLGLFLFGLVLPLSSLSLRPLYRSLIAAGLLLLLFVGAQVAFDLGLIIPLVPFFVALLTSFLVALLISAYRSRRELNSLRSRFAEMDEGAVEAVLAGTVRAGRPTTEQIVPGYRIEALIGRGASGNVYRATRLGTRETVALKVVRPMLSGDDNALGQFEREFQAARLLEHPKIVRIVDEGTVQIVYAASEYMPLGDLQQVLEASGPFELDEVLKVGDDISSALEAAHDVGLIHRDLKPSNIFRTDNGFKLGDFGIARLSGESTAATGSKGVTGTVAFAAPEQLGATEEKIGEWTDVYGLAATLFTLLTGEPPFARSSLEETIAAKLRGEPVDLPEELAALGPVFDSALSTDPRKRPASPEELVASLRKAAGQG